MTGWDGFLDYVLEQGLAHALGVAWIAVAVYAGVLAVLALGAARVWGARAAWTFFAASSLATWAFASTIVVIEMAALYFRHVPHGHGMERQGEDREQFVGLAHVAVGATYLVWILTAAVLALLLRRRLQGRSRSAAFAVVVAIVGFLVVSAPSVEFLNACNIGEPIVLDASC